MHDMAIVAIPLIAILAAIVIGRNDINHLRTEIGAQLREARSDAAAKHSEAMNRFTQIEADLRQVYLRTPSLPVLDPSPMPARTADRAAPPASPGVEQKVDGFTDYLKALTEPEKPRQPSVTEFLDRLNLGSEPPAGSHN
jgi:Sec-independent protein translocase protein TatA